MYDHVIPEQHEKFSSTVQNDSAAAANNQTMSVNFKIQYTEISAARV